MNHMLLTEVVEVQKPVEKVVKDTATGKTEVVKETVVKDKSTGKTEVVKEVKGGFTKKNITLKLLYSYL